jgi:FKBP-type peptidyl-prolyl cis-trans isomerase
MLRSTSIAVALTLACAACQKSKSKDDQTKTGAVQTVNTGPMQDGGPPLHHGVVQIPAPFDVGHPPDDAKKTADGVIFKAIAEGTGPAPGRNDTVMIKYTGWRSNGDTFVSSKSRGHAMPVPLNNTAPGFAEALTMMKKGGHAMFWLPPDIGFHGRPGQKPETLAFEVELEDVKPAPPVPADVAAAPADARKTAKGVAYKVLTPGTGPKIHFYDMATIDYTAWDAKGRMFDSTQIRKQPRPSAPFRETPGLEDALTQMSPGEHAMFWIPAELNKPALNTPDGATCYDLTLVSVKPQHAPPPTPADVAAPPKNAKKTALGVFYKVLKPGDGKSHPTTSDSVKVHYTGWTTDGRMFDSSVVRDKPAEFGVTQVIKGWTDGLQIMSPGEQVRFWIPEELAYKGQPGRPKGMLIFDVQLLEIHHRPARPPMPPGHAGMGMHGGMPHGGAMPHGGMHVHMPPPGAHPPAAHPAPAHP